MASISKQKLMDEIKSPFAENALNDIDEVPTDVATVELASSDCE